MTWGVAFLITQCVEVPVYAWLLRGGLPVLRLLAGAFVVSALTHPWLWFVLPTWLMPALGYSAFVAVGEGLVVLAEAGVWVLLGVTPGRAAVAALVANASSFAVGWAVAH